MKTYGFSSVDEARSMLAKLGAPPRLVRHTVLVGEAVEDLGASREAWKAQRRRRKFGGVGPLLRGPGETDDAPARALARGPPYWKSRVLRRAAVETSVA